MGGPGGRQGRGKRFNQMELYSPCGEAASSAADCSCGFKPGTNSIKTPETRTYGVVKRDAARKWHQYETEEGRKQRREEKEKKNYIDY